MRRAGILCELILFSFEFTYLMFLHSVSVSLPPYLSISMRTNLNEGTCLFVCTDCHKYHMYAVHILAYAYSSCNRDQKQLIKVSVKATQKHQHHRISLVVHKLRGFHCACVTSKSVNARGFPHIFDFFVPDADGWIGAWLTLISRSFLLRGTDMYRIAWIFINDMSLALALFKYYSEFFFVLLQFFTRLKIDPGNHHLSNGFR